MPDFRDSFTAREVCEGMVTEITVTSSRKSNLMSFDHGRKTLTNEILFLPPSPHCILHVKIQKDYIAARQSRQILAQFQVYNKGKAKKPGLHTEFFFFAQLQVSRLVSIDKRSKGKAILYSIGGQTGKDCLLTWASGVKSRWLSGIEPASNRSLQKCCTNHCTTWPHPSKKTSSLSVLYPPTRSTLVCEVIRYRLIQVRQNLNKKKNFSGWRPAMAFLYLFLYHFFTRLSSFLSQNKNQRTPQHVVSQVEEFGQYW